jgi:hypothetical protein
VRPNIDFPILADPDLEKKINLDDLIGRVWLDRIAAFLL